MKNIVKRVLSFMIVLMLVVMMLPVSEVKAENTQTPEQVNALTGNIVVDGVHGSDELVAVKIIKIECNDDNTISYSWVNGVIGTAIKTAYNSIMSTSNDEVTVEEFYADTVTDEQRKKILAVIPFTIQEDNENEYTENVPTYSTVTDGKKTATWTLGLGGYIIYPTSSTQVYQIMLADVEPKSVNGVFEAEGTGTADRPYNVKRNPVSITKEVLEADGATGIGKVVNYRIMADVPTYDAGAKDTTYIIGDLFGTGLDYVDNSLKVYGYTVTSGSISSGTKNLMASDTNSISSILEFEYETGYTNICSYFSTDSADADNDYKMDDATKTFAIRFFYRAEENSDDDGSVSLEESSIKTIVIEYQARINDTATVGDISNGASNNTNTATMEYVYYPFSEDNHTTATAIATVETYKIEITKKDKSTSVVLADAEFDLYYDVTDFLSATDLDKSKTIITGNDATTVGLESAKSYIKVNDSSIITDDEGKAVVGLLDNGIYYLVETKAPAGYSKLAEPEDFEIDGANNTLNVENSQGFTLPETGGTGTVIFTVVGVSLMCVAVLAFFILRKKEMSKN